MQTPSVNHTKYTALNTVQTDSYVFQMKQHIPDFLDLCSDLWTTLDNSERSARLGICN